MRFALSAAGCAARFGWSPGSHGVSFCRLFPALCYLLGSWSSHFPFNSLLVGTLRTVTTSFPALCSLLVESVSKERRVASSLEGLLAAAFPTPLCWLWVCVGTAGPGLQSPF